MSRGRILIFIQWGVSVVLVWYLLSKIDFAESFHALRNINVGLLMASVVQLALQPVLGALRWVLVVRALGGELRFATALRYVWIGTFFSQALPGVVGGDVVRIWLYWRDGAGHRLAINSVALGTVIMMLSLFILVAAVQPGLVARSGSLVATWLPLLMLAAAASGLAMLMFSDRLVRRFYHLRPFRAISYLAVDARQTLLHPFIFAALTVISILAYLNMAITVWLIALALGLNVSVTDCLVLVPVVVLAATIPISVGGWGVRESAIVVLFATIGVSSGHALTLSVLFGIAGILVSLPGVALWLSGGFRRSDILRAAAFTKAQTPKD
jgi:glycosyltransferase 2 family protein